MLLPELCCNPVLICFLFDIVSCSSIVIEQRCNSFLRFLRIRAFGRVEDRVDIGQCADVYINILLSGCNVYGMHLIKLMGRYTGNGQKIITIIQGVCRNVFSIQFRGDFRSFLRLDIYVDQRAGLQIQGIGSGQLCCRFLLSYSEHKLLLPR